MSRSRDDSMRTDGEEAILSPTIPIRPGERRPAKGDSATAPVSPESSPSVNRITPHLLPITAPTAFRFGQEIGGYEILEELARGGMGVVYRAYQKSLSRTVALKMILRGAFAQFEDLVRFRSEAQAIARLHHPNLVSIYEIGEHEGLPFYAMEFLEGGSLAKRLGRKPLEPRAAAELMLPIARAIDYAHSRGVIHRDLKPANILFAIADAPLETSLPKVTDFGIAKQMGDVSNLTRTGEILGTPAYMAPEQATGHACDVGPGADVYSLGAILYETLTGQSPFFGSDGADTILRVLHTEPTSPRKINPNVTVDLETICLKCLEKDPAKRYPTAGLLADDLQRYLANEPILARPASRRERIRKWIKRRPVQATALASGLMLLVVGVASIVMLWQQAVAKAAVETEMVRIKEEKLVEVKSLLADALLDQGISLAEKRDIRRGLHWMLRSLEVAEAVNDPKAQAVAEAVRFNLAHWGQYATAPDKRLPHKEWAWDVGFSPDGKRALTAGRDKIVRIWDADTGQPIGPPMTHDWPVWSALYHANDAVVTGSGEVDDKKPIDDWRGEIRVYRAAADSLGRFEKSASFALPSVGRLVFSPDRKFLAVMYQRGGFGILKFAADGETPLTPVFESHQPAVTAEFSADSKHLYVATYGGDIETIDVGRTAIDRPPLRIGTQTSTMKLSPDRKTLFVATVDKKTKVAAVNAVDLATYAVTRNVMEGHGFVKTMAFSPDGGRIAVSFDVTEGKQPGGLVRVAEFVAGGKASDCCAPLAHPESVWSMEFHRSGKLLVTGCRDANSRIWEISSGKPIAPPVTHEGNVVKVTISPDGRQFLSASAGGNSFAQARLQEIPLPATLPRMLDPTPAFIGAQWLDDRHVVVKDRDFNFARWDVLTGRKVADIPRPTQKGEFDLRHPRLVAKHDRERGKAMYYDVHTGNFVHEVPYAPIDGLDFNSIQIRGAVPLYDRETRRLSLQRIVDGAHLAKPIDLADIPHGIFAHDGVGLFGGIVGVRSKVGDQEIITGSELMVWDMDLKVRRSWDFKSRVFSAAFSPRGDAIAVFSDYQVEMLDLATGAPRMRPISHEGTVHALFFHPTANVLGYGLPNGSVLLWHTRSSKPIGKAINLAARPNFFSPCPDGSGYLACGENSRPVFWAHLEPARGSVAELRTWVEDVTGVTLDANDELSPIDTVELQRRRMKRSS